MSFYDDASLAFLPSGAAGKDGKAYSIKPVPEYGSELVTNGDFASNINDWAAKDCTIVWDNGKIKCDNSSGNGGGGPRQNVGLQNSKTYRFTATIQLISASANGTFGIFTSTAGGTGQSTVYTGSTLVAGGDAVTEIGEFTTGTDGDVSIQFNVDRTNAVFTVDNVSVKEVLVGDGDFTFSRGSNLAATRIGADGLIEKGRENLLLQSNNFDTTWNKQSVSVTSGQSGYDGGSDAWTLESSIIGGYIRQYISVSGVNTISIYAKANSTDGVALRLVGITNNPYIYFDLTNGNLLYQDVSSDIINVNDSESLGGGWYRFSVSLNGSLTQVRMYPSNTSTQQVIGSIYIQDAQLEIGTLATDYIESGATTGKAGLLEDEPRFDYSGGATCPSLLLEPSRTNLFTQSEYFNSSDWIKSNVTATNNSAISPDGLQNATLINDGTASGTQHWFYQSITLSSGTTYTISFYAKYVDRKNMFINIYDGATSNFVYYDIQNGVVLNANGNAVRDIVDVGSGWYRITYTRTIVGSGANFRIGMANDTPVQTYTGENKEALIYGLQLEAGSYPTSYIPNHSGGSVTRGFDYSIVESLGYSSTYTFYYEFNTTTGRETSSPFAEIGKDQSNKIWIKGASANGPQFSVQGNGIFSGSISPTNEVSGTNKIAVQWSSGVGVVFSNGVKQSGTLTNSNTSENIDFISAKGQGTSHDSKQLLFFEEALSDADCITLTTL